MKLANIDMKEIYKQMICMHMDWPSFKVFDDLEVPVIRVEMDNGNNSYYLANNPDMIEVLMDELEHPKALVQKANDFENHRLENEELMEWVYVAMEIAEMLDINCPQISFWESEDAGNFGGECLLFLPDKKPEGKLNIIEMFVCIAHELRHEWQHEYHPDWNEGYVSGDEGDMLEYLTHKTEVDAEAFARKLAMKVFGIDLFNDKNNLVIDKLIARADEIELPDFDEYIFEGLSEKLWEE